MAKLKAFADNFNVAQIKNFIGKAERYSGKKGLLPAFAHFYH